MKKLTKTTCFLTSLILCLGLCGCNSNDKSSSNIESAVETTEEKPTEAPTEPKLYEENQTIVNLLKKGFTYDSIGTPTINFDVYTNTYVVIVPTESDIWGSVFDKAFEDGKWDSHVDKFIELTNSIADAISIIDNEENINLRITHTLKTPSPLIVIENGKLVFNIYDSESSEEALYILRTQCDLHPETVGNVDIKYEANNNSYTAMFYYTSDQVEFFENEKFTTAFLELNIAYKKMIETYDNPDMIFQAILMGSKTPFYTIENGKITLDTINNTQ